MKGKQIPSKQKEQSLFLSNATIADLFGKDKWRNLFAPVDISSLVFFRILFGMLMLYEVSRYFSHNWIPKYWIIPTHHFTYFPFDFLSPLPGEGMFYLFYFMGLLSLFVALGFFYRMSMFLFWLCFSYMFLLEQTRYMNHFYLIVLVSFVMIFVPLNSSASLDSMLFKKTRSETAPAWSLWLMRFMIAVPYFFGGVAKINSDWLQGQPMMMWLRNKEDLPSFISNLFNYDWAILFMSYSGMFLDLLIVPALLFNKTRKWGFLFIFLFHLFNSQLFQIGIFPWFMIAATSLYFNPDWLRKIINFVTGNGWKITTSNTGSFSVGEAFTSKQKLTVTLLLLWIGIQVALPLRHFFIPGSAHWTEEGHRYAWHMKLRTKRGIAVYTAKDKVTGIIDTIDIMDYLNKSQKKKMNTSPYLIWQFCHMIKKDYAKNGKEVAVYADVKASLNGRKFQQFIDPKVDITSVPRPFFPASWIIPLHTPLNDRLDDPNNNEESTGE